jgi:hypothetical protein
MAVLMEADTEPTVHAQVDQRMEWRRYGRDRRPRMEKTAPLEFEPNKFTFCRIRYSSYGGRWGWDTDYPYSDRNFSLRLSQLTTIEVEFDEDGDAKHVYLRLTDPELFNYPWIYMLEVGALTFSEDECDKLREYLTRGGFLFVDDFWGEREWENWVYEISKVFPPNEYPMFEIPITHEIFRCVFTLDEMPQIPSINAWRGGVTWERPDAKVARLWGIKDKKGRLMAVIAHNTDLGDGWEREGEDRGYFEEFSAKKAYPLGINIVVYAMTH